MSRSGVVHGTEFAPVIAAWQDIAAGYTDAELELIVAFQRRAEAAMRQQLTLMRHPQAGG